MGLGLNTEFPAAKDAKVTRRTRKEKKMNTKFMFFICLLMRSTNCQFLTGY
jgi:hypothetical protein